MMDKRSNFHICGLSDDERTYELQCQSETSLLNIPDKFEERKYIITSTIRMLAMFDFNKKTVMDMFDASKKLRKAEKFEAIVTDDVLYEWFCSEDGE